MNIRFEQTQNPKPKPPQDALFFGKYFTDHMFVMEYDEGKGWHDPAIVPYAPISMDPASMVLHYGQAVFEGLKCYRAGDGRLLLFRPERNFARLNKSDERVCIPHIDEEIALKALTELIKVEKDWVPSAEGTSLYVRPFTFSTEAHVGVHPSGSYKFVIILSPVGAYYPEGLNPVKIYIEDEYVRAVKGGLGFTKAAANYAASLRAQQKAIELGYTQVLWLDGVERKYVEEVGTMNVFFIINDEIVTPSLEGSILPGVTRDSTIALARSWGVKVTERRIAIDEVYSAYEDGSLKEAFGTGTAAVISPIGEFNWAGRKFRVADGGIGEISARLYEELTGIQYGRLEDKFGWVKEVL
ncbi:MAG: branched-chain amino acid aminotransferase [Clostridiales bacterium]|jgi:branched-chain amino acid aminotransferase|nr:branched-chain amino acid aminotransferase [Clostridiales bacterium]